MTYTQVPGQPQNRHAKIIGSLKCSQFNILKTVDFLIDSGASYTTLLPYDAVRLGISFNILSDFPKPCCTATGLLAFPKVLPDVELHLDRNDGNPNSEEIFVLPFIHCMPPPKRRKRQAIPQREITYSLLGMDVLSNFLNWRWDLKQAYFT